jgi:hypothetical protein
MGWTGDDDPFAQIRLNFPDLQSAVAFAERHGWPYRVEDPPPQRTHLLSYADRFRYDLANAIRRASSSVELVAGEPTRRQINRIAGWGLTAARIVGHHGQSTPTRTGELHSNTIEGTAPEPLSPRIHLVDRSLHRAGQTTRLPSDMEEVHG